MTDHTPAAQAEMQDPISEAIRILTAEADGIRECHTPGSDRDDWTSEPEAKAEYDHMRRVAEALSKLRAPVADEREAFELDFRRRSKEAPYFGLDYGEESYYDAKVNAAWQAWKARAALASTPATFDRRQLRALVDVVWNEATESTAVPDTPWADRMIDKAFSPERASAPGAGEAVTYLGANVAERLESMADDQPPGSQAQSDLYAAATIWRKHIGHHAAPQASAEALVRFCPGCGSVGPVDEKYRDCCPDGNQARMIPQRLAESCRDTFRIAVKDLMAGAAANDGAAPQASEADAAALSTAVDYRRMEDTQVGASEHLAKLAAALGNRDWKWWDSCSFRRLTFEDGPDRRDGGALCGWVQPSDGHPDVSMAPGVREFIEAASPKAIAALAAAYMAALPTQPEQS